MTRHEMPAPEQDSAWDEMDQRRDIAAFRAMELLKETASKMEEWRRFVSAAGDDEVLEIRLDYVLREIEYALRDLGA